MNAQKIKAYMQGYQDGISDLIFQIEFMLDNDAELSQEKPKVSQKLVKGEPKLETSGNSSKSKKAQKDNPPKRKADTGRITALHNAGWSAKKIAEDMGISEATVYNYLKEEKVKDANE